MKLPNLVVIHLESLNSVLYMLHREWFPNINKFVSQSTYYDNYYSTATSTNMVITDLVYGTMYKDERLSHPRDTEHTGYDNFKSIFELMDENGKFSEGLFWPNDCNTQLLDVRHNLGKNINMRRYKDYSLYINELEKVLSEHDEFALFLFNVISHISYNDYKISNSKDMCERWKMDWSALDNWFGKIIDMLEKYDQMDKTVILIYGDHGDDFWGHGFHHGYTHAIEPYYNMIHTPMAIYNPYENKEKNNHDLISTVDLKEILISNLYGEGESILKKRQYVFSRNRYANQSVKKYSFNKSYAVSDGEYLLLVSPKGLELYNNVMDFGNTCNILEFFRMHDGGEIEFNKSFLKAQSRHFLDFFTDNEIKFIQKKYAELHEKLYQYVNKMYKAGNVKKNRLKEELNFEKINYVHDYNLFNANIVDKLEKIHG